MKHQNLQVRTKQFALQVIQFCEAMPKDETARILVRQLLRSGTSVGANYRAACLAKSKPAFISKMGDVLEEADESGYWVELLVDAGRAGQPLAAPLLAEWRSGAVDIVVVNSAESLHNLIAVLGPEGGTLLKRTPLLVVSERMLPLVKQLGFERAPVLAENATDDAVVEALLAWQAAGPH